MKNYKVTSMNQSSVFNTELEVLEFFLKKNFSHLKNLNPEKLIDNLTNYERGIYRDLLNINGGFLEFKNYTVRKIIQD